MQAASSTFSQRSRSVLPPIKSTKGKKDGGNMFANSGPMAHQRRSSLDHGAGGGIEVNSRKNFDLHSDGKSIYKLDPNFSEANQSRASAFQAQHISRNQFATVDQMSGASTSYVTPRKVPN